MSLNKNAPSEPVATIIAESEEDIVSPSKLPVASAVMMKLPTAVALASQLILVVWWVPKVPIFFLEDLILIPGSAFRVTMILVMGSAP